MKMKLAALAASFVLAAALAACGGSPSSAPAQSLPTQPSSAAPESAAPGSETDPAPEPFAAGETEKAVVLGTAEESAIPALWECLREHFAFEEKDTGIAFTVPLKSVGGPASLRILAGEAAEKKEKDKEKDSEGKK